MNKPSQSPSPAQASAPGRRPPSAEGGHGAWRTLDAAGLSLALLDIRNHTLALFHALMATGVEPQRWLLWLGRIGWRQEYWMARHPAHGQGQSARAAVRLPSIEPRADACFGDALADPLAAAGPARAGLPWPGLEGRMSHGPDGAGVAGGAGAADAADPDRLAPIQAAVCDYLLQTLESTQDLLERSTPGDDPWAMGRYVLWHEALAQEAALCAAHSLGANPGPAWAGMPAAQPAREPLLLPSSRWWLGGPSQGFAFAHERGGDWVQVPPFDIDAQPVTWGQYLEFVADGGYDRPELWSTAGWAWLSHAAAHEGRRAPRHVEQIAPASGAVIQSWWGQSRRLSASQPVTHVTWWEADAWCRWAGRRLPTEVEWDLAARQRAGRGWSSGAVREWTASRFEPLQRGPGAGEGAGADVDPWDERDGGASPSPVRRTLRGTSFATPAVAAELAARHAAVPDEDGLWVGFRSCSL